jgi:glycerol-3-phosphate acyltransferase PlsX
MTGTTVIALDAMGGDRAPAIVIEGAAIARERYPNVQFLLFGDESALQPLLDKHPILKNCSDIRHTTEVVAADVKPSVALRQARQSSMRLSIEAVQNGEAGCVVSAGNTGAFMALAKFVLKTLPGIDRPAMASMMPTKHGETVMLDLGVNVECDAENLVQFALMGSIFCTVVLGVNEPTIGLLNVGTEEVKGHDELRAAATLMRERPVPGIFRGYVEGNDIALGTVDVIVTDGFSGNIALKTLEGTAQLITWYVRQTFASSIMARIGYLFAYKAMRKLKLRADPRRYNGAMLLGLQGLCVKSHGGTDGVGFANAVGVAYDLVQYKFNDRIKEEVAKHYGIGGVVTANLAETIS